MRKGHGARKWFAKDRHSQWRCPYMPWLAMWTLRLYPALFVATMALAWWLTRGQR